MRAHFALGTALAAALALLPINAEAAVSHWCAGKRATVVGTDGPDWAEGTPGRDVMSLGGGDDQAFATDGDIICLGAGNDRAALFAGSARIYGGSGNDNMQAGGTSTTFRGGSGADYFRRVGASGADRVYGGSGNDRIFVDDKTAVIKVGTGLNSLFVEETHTLPFKIDLGQATWTVNGVTKSFGGILIDLRVFGTAADTVIGSSGRDWIVFGPGDKVTAGAGDDVLHGLHSSDLSQKSYIVDAGPGADDFHAEAMTNGTAHLGSGNDQIRVFRHSEGVVYGDDGNDEVILDGSAPAPESFASVDAGAGIDRIWFNLDQGTTADLATGTYTTAQGVFTATNVENVNGTKYPDTIYGTNGPNDIFASAGNDALFGRGGDDVLDGGSEPNSADGGPGTDTCIAIMTQVNCER